MNILRDAAIAQATFTAGMMELNGYDVQTTFYSDFTIADHFGVDAVKDTYERAFESWKSNIVYLTELSLVLNHLCWYHYSKNNHELSRLYDELWRTIDCWCVENLEGEDAEYYFKITD